MCHTISPIDNLMQHLLLLAHLHLLGIKKEYLICYEIQQCGSLHVHIIFWAVENDTENITNRIATFIPTTFDEKIYVHNPHIKYKHNLQFCNEKNFIHVEIDVI